MHHLERKVAHIITFLAFLEHVSVSVPGHSSLLTRTVHHVLPNTAQCAGACHAKFLPLYIMHVMNFTRLPLCFECIVEKLGGAWV